MSKVNGLQKEMPPTEDTFTVEVEGEVTKKRYLGEFTCKIPTRKEQCMIDKHRALLNGDIVDYLTPSTLAYHHKIAYLRYTLTQYPKFWQDADLGYGLYDGNVVNEVYDHVLSFEKKWLTEVWGEEALSNFEVEPEIEQPKPKKKA
jgi:hypothetical protein